MTPITDAELPYQQAVNEKQNQLGKASAVYMTSLVVALVAIVMFNLSCDDSIAEVGKCDNDAGCSDQLAKEAYECSWGAGAKVLVAISSSIIGCGAALRCCFWQCIRKIS